MEPNFTITNARGGYIVNAEVRCDCDDPDCGGWKEELSIFVDIKLMMRYLEQVILDYDSHDDLREAVESKLKK